MPKMSLVIPVYNVEDYLRECLDFCINQTLKDIEIICINDASSDNSALILKEYEEKDNRVKIITHEKNRGLGGARNSGKDAATGDYIWFIDSDDFIVSHACEILYSCAIQNNADIVRFNAISFIEKKTHGPRVYDKSKSYYCCNWPYDRVISISKENKRLPQTSESACLYITKKKYFKNVSFREKAVHEDVDFSPILFSHVEKIFCLNYAFYIRRRHQKSITGGGIDSKKLILGMIEASNALFEFIEARNFKSSHFCVKCFFDAMYYLFSGYNKEKQIHTEAYNNIFKKIFKKYPQWKISFFSVKRRIRRKIVNTLADG
jgi:glycosyltransferase involved in cell wall biosynthesis